MRGWAGVSGYPAPRNSELEVRARGGERSRACCPRGGASIVPATTALWGVEKGGGRQAGQAQREMETDPSFPLQTELGAYGRLDLRGTFKSPNYRVRSAQKRT